MFQSEKIVSRKAKEQQAATSSNSLREIKDLLNAKFSELGTRITSLEEKLDNVIKDNHLKLNAVKTTAQEASKYAQENREEIEGLKFRLVELNEAVSNQAITIHQLDIEVEDLNNRSLRKIVVFRNIKKQQSEKTWERFFVAKLLRSSNLLLSQTYSLKIKEKPNFSCFD